MDKTKSGPRPRYRNKSVKEKKLYNLLEAAYQSYSAAMDVVSLNIKEKGSPELKALYAKYQNAAKDHDETVLKYSNKLQERGVVIAAPDLLTIMQTQFQLKVRVESAAVAGSSVSTAQEIDLGTDTPTTTTTTTVTTTTSAAAASTSDVAMATSAPVDSALFIQGTMPPAKPLFSAHGTRKKQAVSVSKKETDYSKTVAQFAQTMNALDAEALELGIELPPEVQAVQDVHSVLGKRVTTFAKQLEETKAAEDEAFKKSDAAKRVEHNRPLEYFVNDVKGGKNPGWCIHTENNLSVSDELKKLQDAQADGNPNYQSARHLFAYSVNKNCIVHCSKLPNGTWDFTVYYQVCTYDEARQYFQQIQGKTIPKLVGKALGSSNYETVNL